MLSPPVGDHGQRGPRPRQDPHQPLPARRQAAGPDLGIVAAGPRVVVLSNQSDEDLCSWRPISARLAASGYRVVLWDFGGGPPATTLPAITGFLHSVLGCSRLHRWYE